MSKPAHAIQPLEDRVLVKREEPKATTKGGIIVPEVAKDPPQLGRVLARGPGRVVDSGLLVPTGVEVGDLVLFGRYEGIDFEHDEEKFVMLRSGGILAVIAEREN